MTRAKKKAPEPAPVAVEATVAQAAAPDLQDPLYVIPGDPPESDSFPPQWGYVTSEALRNLELCSRRSGKTEAKIRRGNRLVVRQKNVLYVGRILKNVRQQFWQPIKDRLTRVGVVYKTNEQDLVLRREGGGMLMGMSCDDIKDIDKGRGYRWDLVMVDEGQSFPDVVLRALIDYVIIPTLIDTGGMMDIGGTPPDPDKGDATDGLFVDLVRQALKNPSTDPRKGWRLHHWTMFDNPHIPRANIEEAYASRGIGPGHPVWEAEVMGRLVVNPAKRVFPYEPERNGFEDLPT